MIQSFELGPIRPPSEADSLLIRATVNCPWNRCKFCPVYKGQKFGYRKVEDIKQDIRTARAIHDRIKEAAWRTGDGGSARRAAAQVLGTSSIPAWHNVALWMHSGGEHCFLQDSNTLIMRTPELAEVIRFLKETFPGINRVTTYGRSDTAARKTPAELVELREAGLTRVHIGLESGHDPLLEYMEKGVTAAEHIAGGRKVVESGLSLCEYVLLGLGGQKLWREHALDTAKVLNEIVPAFIRVRTLTVKEGMPLHHEVAEEKFIRAADERIIAEERLLLENLTCHSSFVSDHITNLLQDIEGKLPEDKEKLIGVMDRFQALSPAERLNFRVGRRAAVYGSLDDLQDPHRREVVDRIVGRLTRNGDVDEELVFQLMERFI